MRKHTQDWNNGIVAGKVNNIKSQNDPNFVPSMGMRMMQMHLGTFSKEGNFEGAVKKLDDIQEMGFNTVELLPHGYFDDVNWGYDPSFVFASQYGGNDKFKKFCDEAHKRELNVVVDVVNNHYSADNKEILKEAGPYSSPHHEHDFGPCPNFTDTEKSNRDAVRDWRINESLYWLANGADGIRYDLSDWTMSPEFNLQLNAEIQEHFPGAPTFAESPEYNSSRPLPDGAINKATGADKENAHLEITKKAQNNEFGSEKEGFTHRWHFDWSHALEKTILHPFDRDVEGLKSQVYDAQNQTKIMFSHDEIGKQEADGNDLTVKVMVGKLFGSDIGDLGWGAERNKQEKYWKASRAVRELTRAYVTGDEWPSNEKQLAKEVGKYGGDVNDHKSDSYGLPDYEKGGLGLADLGWQHGISKKEFGNLFNTAFETDKAAMGFLFSQPGPKMVFQSFDKSDRRFSFFRQGFEVNKDVDRQKGHVIDSQDIIDQAKIDKLNGEYSETALKYQKNMKKLVKALNKLGAENPALQDGEVKDVIGNHNDAISVYSKKGNNEIYSVTNFGDHKNYGSNDKYKIYFPEGTWKEVLNTNAKEFGGSGKYANVVVSGGKEADINLPKASTLIFKRVG